MVSILEFTTDQIHAIGSPELLAGLLRRLLHAEARANNIARRGISAPAQITVSDDGEDARIEWHTAARTTRTTCRLAYAYSNPKLHICPKVSAQTKSKIRPAT